MLSRNRPSSVLAVDDERQILTAIEDLLEEDYNVITTTDPLQGLVSLKDHEFAVILSDQRMPNLPGDEFLTKARRISNASRVLITGYTDIRAAQSAVNHGKIFAYVSKPWDPVGLKKIVDEGVQHYQLTCDLEMSQERKLSLDAARAGMWAWNPGTGDVSWDESMRRLYEVTDDTFSGTFDGWTQLIHPEDLPTFEIATMRSGYEGSVLDLTFRARRGSNAWRHFHIQAVAVRDDAGSVVRLHGLCVDVTEQKETEERLRRYAERLESAQKAQAAQIKEIDRQRRELEKRTTELDASNRELKNFAAVAAHDLKEPLRTIAYHTSLLEESLGESIDEETQMHTLAVCNVSKRLSHLIDAILNYMSLGQDGVVLVPKNLSDVVEDVINILDLTLKEQRVQLKVTGALPSVLCDPHLIGEVFHNLITNAVKYNDKQDKQIEIGVEEDVVTETDRFVVIRVSDNGIGINAEHEDRVFEMFRRLHGRDQFGGGTGVGLTIVKRIIELHQGRIWFESVPAEGTTFFFTLERAPGGPCMG